MGHLGVGFTQTPRKTMEDVPNQPGPGRYHVKDTLTTRKQNPVIFTKSVRNLN